MKNMNIVVLGGGWSSEREISLRSQISVMKGLQSKKMKARAWDLVKSASGKQTVRNGFISLENLIVELKKLKNVFVFLCLHGWGGEDGKIQGLLELAGVSYSGSGPTASMLGMNKEKSKEIFFSHGIATPAWKVIYKKPGKYPAGKWVVKPLEEGSSVGLSLVLEKSDWDRALENAFHYSDRALLEKYVAGREFTVGVLGDQALPVVEIIPKNDFYDWDSKYASGGSIHECPAKISVSTANVMKKMALKTHQVLGCRAYSRTDFIVDKNNKPWVLEINTLPGMTDVSLLPDAARAAGLDYPDLLIEMIRKSLGEH